MSEYKGKKLPSCLKGTIEQGVKEEKSEPAEDFTGLFEVLKSELSEYVKEVRRSDRLTSSPACIVGDEFDLTPQLEQILKATGQQVPSVRRILELNTGHDVVKKLREIHAVDSKDPRIGDFGRLLYGQALLLEGTLPPDPVEFSRKLVDLMKKGM
jgi:molecular chaperone HtpG